MPLALLPLNNPSGSGCIASQITVLRIESQPTYKPYDPVVNTRFKSSEDANYQIPHEWPDVSFLHIKCITEPQLMRSWHTQALQNGPSSRFVQERLNVKCIAIIIVIPTTKIGPRLLATSGACSHLVGPCFMVAYTMGTSAISHGTKEITWPTELG